MILFFEPLSRFFLHNPSCSLTQLRSLNLERFEEDCTALAVDKYQIGQFLVCETPSGMTYEIPETRENFIEENFENGPFVSGETELLFLVALSSTKVFKRFPAPLVQA